MSKLDDLYDSVDKLNKIGMKLTDEQNEFIKETEEEFIKEEVLPSLKEIVVPKLSKIRRDLVLVLEYHPNQELDVSLSWNTPKEQKNDCKTQHENVTDSYNINKTTSCESTIENRLNNNPCTQELKVEFPDGRIVCCSTAIKTFIEVIRIIGFEKVLQSGIKHVGYDLVSKTMRPTKDGRMFQHEIDGFYIYSNLGNNRKAEDLNLLSQKFNLGLKVYLGKSGKESLVKQTNLSSIENALVTEKKTKDFAYKVLRYFEDQFGLEAFEPFFEKNKLVGLRFVDFYLKGLFLQANKDEVMERNEKGEGRRKHIRWFDSPFLINGKEYYLSADWTVNDETHLSLKSLEKAIKICFDEEYHFIVDSNIFHLTCQ